MATTPTWSSAASGFGPRERTWRPEGTAGLAPWRIAGHGGLQFQRTDSGATHRRIRHQRALPPAAVSSNSVSDFPSGQLIIGPSYTSGAASMIRTLPFVVRHSLAAVCFFAATACGVPSIADEP